MMKVHAFSVESAVSRTLDNFTCSCSPAMPRKGGGSKKAEGQRPAGTGMAKASRDAQSAAKRKAGGREMSVDKNVKCPRSHELGWEDGGERGVIDAKEGSAKEAEKAGEEDVDQVGGDAAIDEREGGNGSDDGVDADAAEGVSDAERGLAGASDAAPAALSPASEMPTGTPSKKQVVEGWRPGEKSVLSTGLDGEVAFACSMRTCVLNTCKQSVLIVP